MIERKTDRWALYKHKVNLSNEDKKFKEMLLDILESEKFNTSSISDLMKKIGIKTEKDLNKIIKICETEKLIVRISQNIILSESNLKILKNNLINFFDKNQSINVSEFKDLFNISRKYAIPILEYLDKIKFTFRNGNTRELIK